MPGFVKTPSDEKKWSHAKEIATSSLRKKGGKKRKQTKDSKWKLANWLFHNKLKKGQDQSNTTSFEVYYVGRSGKKIMVEIYDDRADAVDHLKALRKLYGPYIKAGIQQKTLTRFDQAVKRVRDASSKRKVALSVG